MEKQQHHNGFGNGFVLGLLVGVIVTLMVTTKKGRELFKELTTKGLDKFSDLEEKLQETSKEFVAAKDEYDELEEESDYVPSEPAPVRLSDPLEAPAKPLHHEEKQTNGHKPPPRRFFRAKKS